jgi:heme-degrading monooxygenase HmoA
MISRIWHGWTTLENADIYENLLKTEILPTIESKNVSGYRGIQLLRRELANEVEFITIMRFDSLEAVKQFAGEDYEKSYVPDKAKKVLSRHDDRPQHYKINVMYYTYANPVYLNPSRCSWKDYPPPVTSYWRSRFFRSLAMVLMLFV